LNLGENSPLITMVMHAIAEQNGIDFMAIPYKGSAPALTAMLGGDVEMALDTVPTYMPHIKSGKVRALMSTGRARMPALLEVPTGIEAKVIDFSTGSVLGLWAPSGTPDAIVKRLSDEIAGHCQGPGVHRDVSRGHASRTLGLHACGIAQGGRVGPGAVWPSGQAYRVQAGVACSCCRERPLNSRSRDSQAVSESGQAGSRVQQVLAKRRHSHSANIAILGGRHRRRCACGLSYGHRNGHHPHRGECLVGGRQSAAGD
jgi:hypothetical protein